MSRNEFCMAVYIQAVASGKSSSQAFALMLSAGEHYDDYFGDDDE